MTYKQSIEATERVLDSLDILSYSREGEALNTLMDRLDKACADMEELQREPFDTYLFNWMDELEFRDYLLRRYGNRFGFQERTIYYYTRKEDKK